MRLNDLTPRKREVAILLAQGCSRKEIGYRLRIATKTVEVHLAQIYEQFGIHKATELVRLVVEDERNA